MDFPEQSTKARMQAVPVRNEGLLSCCSCNRVASDKRSFILGRSDSGVKDTLCFLCQECCNNLQRLRGSIRAAVRAISAYFQASHNNMEVAIALNLSLEAVEKIAFEFE